jgi:transcriptional regulator with XRE-family HTH domain
MGLPEENYKKPVGNRIRRAYMVAGWKQEEFAKRSELGQSAMSKIVNGRQMVDSKQMLEIVLTLKDSPVFARFSVGEIQEYLYSGTPLMVELTDPSSPTPGEAIAYLPQEGSDLLLPSRQDEETYSNDELRALAMAG